MWAKSILKLTEQTGLPSLLASVRRRVLAHLSVKSSGGSWIGESCIWNGWGYLHGVQGIGSPCFWRCWNQGSSRQIIRISCNKVCTYGRVEVGGVWCGH